jgi:protein-disulfide isomerase
MSSKTTDRRAKLQAAAPQRGGSANRFVVATVIAVLAIAAVVGGVIFADQQRKSDLSAGGTALPKNAAAMGAGILANPGAPADAPTVDLYEDFQCPACAQMEAKLGPKLTEMAQANQIRLVVHMMSFLDDNLRNDSSNRAANAAASADDQGRFLEFHNATFAGQPANEGDGYTDAQLKGFAEAAGITGAALDTWEQSYRARAHNQYVESVQTQSGKDGVTGTPTLKLNGEQLDWARLTPEALEAAVKAATQ